MKELNVKQLPDNFFTAIGKEWMLVTSGDKEHFNTMTASWGCVGWLWNKPVAVIFIRPERYTHEFIEQNETLTLSFLGHEEEMRKAYNVCGSRSGRDTDKIALTGLKPIATPSGNVTFEQARLTLECRKLYKNRMSSDSFLDSNISQWYGEGKGSYHDIYILEIAHAYGAE